MEEDNVFISFYYNNMETHAEHVTGAAVVK